MDRVRRLRRAQRRAGRGVAGIEFAMIASLLVIVLIGIVDLGGILIDRRDMRSALQSGGQYFMVGGTDIVEARGAIEASWGNRPDDATLTIERICFCAGQVHACNANCPDTSLPEMFHVISATARFSGLMMEYDNVVQESVRVR